MYLQENSTESAIMRQNVRNILLSKDESNLQLAFQLIESGGMHSDLYMPLCLLAVEELWSIGANEDDMRCLKLLKKSLPAENIAALKEGAIYWVWWGIFAKRLSEHFAHDEGGGNFAFMASYWQDLVIMAFRRSGHGGGTCYVHKLLPATEILERMQEEAAAYGLDLWDFELEDLASFPELADLQNIERIHLNECSLAKLSPATWQNPHITLVNLSEEKKHLALILQDYFPNTPFYELF